MNKALLYSLLALLLVPLALRVPGMIIIPIFNSGVGAVDYGNNLYAGSDANFMRGIEAQNFFRNGINLIDILTDVNDTDTIRTYTGINPIKSDNDANTIGVLPDFNWWYWSKFGTDLNAMIDVRAKAQDTNGSTGCDGNTVLTGDNICVGITGFYLSGGSGTDTDTIRTYTGLNPIKVDNDTNQISGIADFNKWFWSRFGTDLNATIDVRAKAQDTNSSSGCDGNTVLTGDNICVGITGFYQSGGSVGYIPTDADIDANAIGVCSAWFPIADANVADNITLTNLTQITTRSYADLQNKPSMPVIATPWQDANLWRYISNEQDIDGNCTALDTNIFMSGVADCAADNYVYGFNANGTLDCRADVGGGGTDTDTIRTYTALTPVKIDNDTNQVALVTDINKWFWGRFDPDLNRSYESVFDLNNHYYLKYVLYTKTDVNQQFYGKVDLNSQFYSKIDVNQQYYGKVDINSQFVSYIGGTRDLNMGYRDLNARAVSAENLFGSGKSLTGVQKTADANNFFSQISTTYNKVDVNTIFVPYAGAIANMNLGTKKLSGTGDWNASNLGVSTRVWIGSGYIDHNGTHLIIHG